MEVELDLDFGPVDDNDNEETRSESSEKSDIDYPDTPGDDNETGDRGSPSPTAFDEFVATAPSGWDGWDEAVMGSDSDIDIDSNDGSDIIHTIRRATRGSLTTCGICATEYPRVVLDGSLLSLSEVENCVYEHLLVPSEDRLDDKLVFAAPCRKSHHVYCVGCLRKILFMENVIRQNQGHIYCLSSSVSNPCTNDTNRPFVYDQSAIRMVLNPIEMTYFVTTAKRFQTGETRVVTDSYNHYVWPVHQFPAPAFPYMTLQNEVDAANVILQFRHILQSDKLEVKCKECGVFLQKGTQCNSLSHCGIETCNVCGYSAPRINPHHWNMNIKNGCPRYDEQYPNIHNYCCTEGKCYTDFQECQIPSHRTGIQEMIAFRRQSQLIGLYLSLSFQTQIDVKKELTYQELEQIHSLFPKFAAIIFDEK